MLITRSPFERNASWCCYPALEHLTYGPGAVGVTNAVRAGELIDRSPSDVTLQRVGTINIVIIITNAALAVSAMVTAVRVATESKAAALLAKRIPSWTGRSDTTGTGTDAVVIANGNGPLIRYSGTPHTRIGELHRKTGQSWS